MPRRSHCIIYSAWLTCSSCCQETRRQHVEALRAIAKEDLRLEIPEQAILNRVTWGSYRNLCMSYIYIFGSELVAQVLHLPIGDALTIPNIYWGPAAWGNGSLAMALMITSVRNELSEVECRGWLLCDACWCHVPRALQQALGHIPEGSSGAEALQLPDF